MSDRPVATDALATLGTVIDDKQKRDAIHLAVEPVEAGERLMPGDHIDVTAGVAIRTKVGEGLGIVDPFLPGPVYIGQRFWFVMYPRMVTSLRHVWTHPAFMDESGVVAIAATPVASEDSSRAWIEAFAERIGQTYQGLMDAAERWESTGRYTYDNSESYKGYEDEFPLFWDHWKTVTGRTVQDKDSLFTCSC